MPGSGQLGLRMAAAFGLPHSTVTTAIKALRAGRLLSIKGRGASAAQMTPADAAAITVGIMSAAVSAEMPAVTKLLLQMPSRHFVRPTSRNDAKRLIQPSPHSFQEGFCALFDDGWENRENGDRFDSAGTGDMHAVRIALGLNGHKKQGFAVVEINDSKGRELKNFYSTMRLRAGVSADENPAGLGLDLYRDPPNFVFEAEMDNRAVSALRRALAEPVAQSRDPKGTHGSL